MTPAALATQAWPDLLRHDVIPVLSGYVVAMAILWAGRRPRVDGRIVRGGAPTWLRLARYLVGTAVGGYAVFIAVILLYYLALGGQDVGFIRDALVGGAWLAFGVGVPALLVFGLIEGRARAQSGGS
jgi:uncharacterized protein DUF6256